MFGGSAGPSDNVKPTVIGAVAGNDRYTGTRASPPAAPSRTVMSPTVTRGN